MEFLLTVNPRPKTRK